MRTAGILFLLSKFNRRLNSALCSCVATCDPISCIILHSSFRFVVIVLLLQTKLFMAIYLGPNGYLSFSDGPAILNGGEDHLEMRFSACEDRGILLYATSSNNPAYFAIGLVSSQLLIEFRDNSGLKEVCILRVEC